MEKAKWTLIISNVDNKYVKTNHYYGKAQAMEDLRYYTNLGYIVTILAHSIYQASNKKQLES